METKNTGLLYESESFSIRYCIFEVNRKLGGGFLEAVYQEALEKEFIRAEIPHEVQKRITILYDGEPLRQYYVADFVCYGKIIVEIKAVRLIEEAHKAQVLNYLAATGLKLGFLVNFGAYPKSQIIRIVR